MWATYVSCWAYCVCRSEIRWECAAAHFCCVGGCEFVFWTAGCFFASYWWRLEVYECSCPSHAPPSVTVLLKSLCKETQQYYFTKDVSAEGLWTLKMYAWVMAWEVLVYRSSTIPWYSFPPLSMHVLSKGMDGLTNTAWAHEYYTLAT